MILKSNIFTKHFLSSIEDLNLMFPPAFSFLCFVFNRDVVNKLCEEAWSMPYANSWSSSTHYWNNSWQTSA